VGTSAVVYPAVNLIYTAKQSGAYLVEVNIEETEVTSIANTSFFGEAGKILPEIINSIKNQAKGIN
jgi:NAD-dependent deacetylase